MTHEDDYLFDKSAPADPEVERLERLLARYRHEPSSEFSARLRRGTRARPWLWLAAAGIAALSAFAWRALSFDPADGYRLRGIAGRERLQPGEQFANDSDRRARVELGWLGHVDVDPGSVLRVEDCGTQAHRLYLERGAVDVRVTARARVFQIGTPAGQAIDLGCAYNLAVDDDGLARLHVSDGQVAFEFDGREVYVPAGASCISWPGRGPRAPLFDAATEEFRQAVDALEFADVLDPGALAVVLDIGPRENTLTLWHLFDARTSSRELQRALFERLSEIYPKPGLDGVDQIERDKLLLKGDRALRAAWMERMQHDWKIQ